MPLAPGQNTLTAKLTEAKRYTTEDAISIQSTATAQGIALIPNMEEGISPLAVDFLLSANLDSAITSYELDVDGNGVADYSGTGTETFSHNYPGPGIYYAQATVRDAWNNVYTDAVGINVLSRADMDSLFQAKWNGMKSALGSINPAAALSYFTAGSHDKYNQIFGALGTSLPSLAAGMGNIEMIYAKGGMAKYRITMDQDAGGAMQTITYYIYFVKDRDGFWKIRDF